MQKTLKQTANGSFFFCSLQIQKICESEVGSAWCLAKGDLIRGVLAWSLVVVCCCQGCSIGVVNSGSRVCRSRVLMLLEGGQW